jgi:hypothetical protein
MKKLRDNYRKRISRGGILASLNIIFAGAKDLSPRALLKFSTGFSGLGPFGS